MECPLLIPALTAAVALLAQAPASAPTPAAQTAAAAPAAPASDAKICRSETDTGTRFSHRECHTSEEWRVLAAQARDSVSNMQQRGGMTGGPH
jgi:hypothetical protein